MSWKFVLVIAVIIGLWLYFKIVSPRPKFPPLEIDPDDPLMKAAMEKAKNTLEQFKALYKKYPQDAFVKLYFVSNTNNVEHLGAYVEEMHDDQLKVILVTPPVSHRGHLDREYTCTFDDIEDWQITDADGNIYGGFTQQVMFKIARNKGIKLPKELLEMEKRYLKN